MEGEILGCLGHPTVKSIIRKPWRRKNKKQEKNYNSDKTIRHSRWGMPNDSKVSKLFLNFIYMNIVCTCMSSKLFMCCFQVENAKFFQTVFKLWKEERFGMFTKGMSARIIQSCIYSIFIISPYETIKRLSIKDEYKHLVRWWPLLEYKIRKLYIVICLVWYFCMKMHGSSLYV